MEQFQGPGACLVVEWIIQEGTDDASQEKGQFCLFVLERYPEGSKHRKGVLPTGLPFLGHISS